MPVPIHVIYTADIDCVTGVLSRLRANPNNEMFGDVTFNFENVSYVLNAIDRLSGDDRFLAIRTRKFTHPTLRAVEMQTETASNTQTNQEVPGRPENGVGGHRQGARRCHQEDSAISSRQPGRRVTLPKSLEFSRKITLVEESLKKKADARKKERQREIQQSVNESSALRNEQEVQRIQNTFKACAVLLPLVPPLLLGLVVFARRRVKEREGISKERMR